MKIEIKDEYLQLLLETVAERHMVEYLKGKNNDRYDNLIKQICASLIENGRKDIFDSVFQEVK